VEPDILLETDAKGRGNWQFGEDAEDSAGQAESAGADDAADGESTLPSVHLFALSGGTLTYNDGVSGERLVVHLESVAAESEGLSDAITFSALGAFDGAPFELSGSLGAFTDFNQGKDIPVGLTALFGGAELALDGRAALKDAGPQADLNFSFEGKSLADFGEALKASFPPIGPYRLSGRLESGENIYRVSGLDLVVGSSDFSGTVEIDLGAARPKVTGSLFSRNLDMADFLKEGDGTAASNAQSQSPFVIPDTPLPLDALSAADVKLDLKVERLSLPSGSDLTGLVVALVIDQGVLRADPIEAGLASGRINASLSLDSKASPASLKFTLDGKSIDYGQLLRDAEVSEELSGKLDVEVALKGAGASPRAIASQLDGKAVLSSRNGTIDNRLFRVLAVGLGDITGPLLGQDRTSNLNCLYVGFDFDDGLGRSRGLVLDSEAFTLNGAGNVNLADESLKFDFQTATRQASVASLAIPFKVRGTLKNPKVALDALGAGGSLVDDDPCALQAGAIETEAPAKSAAATSEPAAPAPEPSPEQGSDDDSIGNALESFKKDLGKIGDLFD
jgi:hypothetical protein